MASDFKLACVVKPEDELEVFGEGTTLIFSMQSLSVELDSEGEKQLRDWLNGRVKED